MTLKPTVSIIVLNWNGKQYLEPCLSSLLQQTNPDIEIIFVDNGSCDGSVKFVKSKYPGVIILPHDKNIGFAMGVNSGIMKDFLINAILLTLKMLTSRSGCIYSAGNVSMSLMLLFTTCILQRLNNNRHLRYFI